jgi:hypothetical protein
MRASDACDPMPADPHAALRVYVAGRPALSLSPVVGQDRGCGWPHRNLFMFASSYAVLLSSGLFDKYAFSLTGIIRMTRY